MKLETATTTTVDKYMGSVGRGGGRVRGGVRKGTGRGRRGEGREGRQRERSESAPHVLLAVVAQECDHTTFAHLRGY